MRSILLIFILFFVSCGTPPVKEKDRPAVGGGQKTVADDSKADRPVAEKKRVTKATSSYSDLVENKCQDVDVNEEEEWSVQSCPGMAGYTLEVVEGDLRQTINVITPQKKKYELDLWTVVSNRPSTVGDKAEWRMESIAGKQTPTALIVRYNVNADLENTDKILSYLTVSKLSPAGACVTAIVPPMKNANVEARKRAAVALKSQCLPVKK